MNEPIVFDAVRLMLDTWVVEQHHEARSPYRYSELPRNGLGSPVAYTGARQLFYLAAWTSGICVASTLAPRMFSKTWAATAICPAGMTWSGFRPSDDPTQYGYLVPANM